MRVTVQFRSRVQYVQYRFFALLIENRGETGSHAPIKSGLRSNASDGSVPFPGTKRRIAAFLHLCTLPTFYILQNVIVTTLVVRRI